MKIDLTGKKAIVTGSTSGIGLAIARGLAVAGASVVINGRTQAAIDRAKWSLGSARLENSIDGFAGDLGTSAGCAALISAHPDCDILVNNLGIYGPQDFFETDDVLWEELFEVNVLSGVRLSRAFLPRMKDRGWGRVVFISSEAGLNIPADSIPYAFTKTAQLSIGRGLAKRMAGTGVTVNSVLPGPTLSEGVARMLQVGDDETGEKLEVAAAEFVLSTRPSSIIRRAATVDEVANMVVYVCSREASATTGAALRVEGGIVDSL
ncbi:short-chain dehydrogenase/reductase [Agrobacterium sp. ATCC 31749]|uniref:SDR family NAD(P)-dependent oxidoreductase n=1 Tax=unclassified Agrobacterium TaxID=2632611 RepID=UPI00020DBE55|nr:MULTISPECIES: SDR family oxidoreductase [unclassified Agrobacterium]EGL62101.1 short-chain dehydrogenase/reductase [Agrobacterium sp. ATCC 31749]QKX00494.1 SDR family NAD(P)-dependent oxidoreductase [Agrobacterium sp. CGMCC 11546]